MDLQTIFSNKLDNIRKVSQVVSDIGFHPENDELAILRTFEDFSDDIDTKLKRRLVYSQKFSKYIIQIREALSSGKFVINIIAPEYAANKDLVDLLISHALTDSPSASMENASLEEKLKDRDNRHSKMSANIVSDIDVSRFLSKSSPDIEESANQYMDPIFFGSEYFDPRDPVNCCEGYIKDYLADPNVDETQQNAAALQRPQQGRGQQPIGPQLSPRDQVRTSRNSMFYGYKNKPGDLVDFGVENLQKTKSNLIIGNPLNTSSSTPQKPSHSTFPGIYFNERTSHLRFDPRNPLSYRYPDLYRTQESQAADRLKSIMDTGGVSLSADLKRKWMIFTQIISSIQGSPLVSMFYPPGFDANGEPRSFLGIPAFSYDRVSVEVINSLVEGFLNDIGVHDSAVSTQMEAAIHNLMSDQESPSSATQTTETAKEDLSNMAEQERIQFFARKIHEDSSIARPIKLRNVREWITNNYSDYASMYDGDVYLSVQSLEKKALSNNYIKLSDFDMIDSMSKISAKEIPIEKLDDRKSFNNWMSNKFGEDNEYLFKDVFSLLKNSFSIRKGSDTDSNIRIAVVENVLRSRFYNSIKRIIQNNRSLTEALSEDISAEYVIDLLLKYIVKKAKEEKVVDLESIRKNGIRPNVSITNISINKRVLTIPFGKAEQEKFGIGSEQTFLNTFYNGARISIVSDDGRSETKVISRASIVDGMTEKRYDPNGPSCRLVFTEDLNNYQSGSYTIILARNNEQSITGLFSDIYSDLYGEDSKNVMRRHKENGIELSLSIYAPWVPSQFDFRSESSESIGHPNNAYSLRKCLNDRLSLRDRMTREMQYGGSDIQASYISALNRLNQEIAEINMILFEYVPFRYKTIRGVIGKDKDVSRSMIRGKTDYSDYFREVQYRCLREGFDIGSYGSSIDSKAIQSVLDAENFAKFERIRDSVLNEFNNRRNITILRGADIGSSSPRGNGFLSIKKENTKNDKGEDKEVQSYVWSAKFEANVSRLHHDIAGQASSGGTESKDQKSSIIIITEQRIPKLVEEPAYVYLPTDSMGFDEIEVLIDFYSCREKTKMINKINSIVISDENQEVVKKKENQKNILISRAEAFSIPLSFIRMAQQKLTDLNFQTIDKYLEKIVSDLFNMYIKSKGNMTQVMDVSELRLKTEMEDFQAQDSRLKSMGIRCSAPAYTLNEYVTKTGSPWSSHVHGDEANSLRVLVDQLKGNDNQINLLTRCLDTGIYFGIFSIEGDKEFKVSFNLPPPTTADPVVWFNGNGDLTIQVKPDQVLSQLALYSGYSIDRSFIEEIMSNNKYKNFRSNKINIKISEESLSSYFEKIKSQISFLEKDSRSIKEKYPVLLVLEGDPGTGKSIYPEVVSWALGCKYMHSTFESIFYAGESHFRGVVENNVERFFELLRTLRDTVLLIDEVDKFLVQNKLSGSANDANAAISRIQKNWDLNADFPVYQNHNLHIILTTNYWKKIQKESSAISSRVPSKTVLLPTDPQTLKRFFLEGALINNLINTNSGGNISIAAAIKDILRLYKNGNESDQAVVRMLVDRVEKLSPGFFYQKALLRPQTAKNKWLEKRGIAVTKTADSVDDYIMGWKMLEDMIQKMSNTIIQKVGDEEKPIIPLDVICQKMSMLTEYHGKNRNYSRASMRELMRLFEDMVKSHNSYLEGNNSLPFNWRTLFATLSETTFQQTIEEDKIDAEDRANPEFMKELKTDRVDGFSALTRLALSSDISATQKLPIAFWSTREQYTERIRENIQDLKDNRVEKNNDRGEEFLINRVSSSFFVKNNSMNTQINNLKKVASEGSVKGNGGANILFKFINIYEQARIKIEENIKIYESNKDVNAFNEIKKTSIWIYRNYNDKIAPLVSNINQFLMSVEKGNLNIVFTNILSGIKVLGGSLDTLNMIALSYTPNMNLDNYWDRDMERSQRSYETLSQSGFSFAFNQAYKQLMFMRQMTPETYEQLGIEEQEEISFMSPDEAMEEMSDNNPHLVGKEYSEQRMKKIRDQQDKLLVDTKTDGDQSSKPSADKPADPSNPSKSTTPKIEEEGSIFDNVSLNTEDDEKDGDKDSDKDGGGDKGKSSSTTDYYYKIAKKLNKNRKIVSQNNTNEKIEVNNIDSNINPSVNANVNANINKINGDEIFLATDFSRMIKSLDQQLLGLAKQTKAPLSRYSDGNMSIYTFFK